MSEERWIIRHVDLAEGPQAVTGPAAPHLLVFWWRDLPLGKRALLAAEMPFRREQVVEEAARLIADQAHARGRIRRAGYDGIPRTSLSLEEALGAGGMIETLDQLAAQPAPGADNLSVVICTRDRPKMLQGCLESLAAQAAPPGQVVVVDNSGDGNARGVCEGRAGVTYVHEPRPGLSVARNAGIEAARGEFVAFTDDDVELPANWTSELVRAFQNSDADAVTGLVLPARLDTAAQRAFELDLGGFTSRFFPLVFDQSFLDETKGFGPQVWRIGAGANMAFRRTVFARFGGFDERLGAGASGCSEDSEYWYRILNGGGVCLYEPRCVVSHHHRADWAGLRSQFRAYMKGHVAALVAQADRYGHRGNIRRIFRQLPAYFARTAAISVQNLTWWRLAILTEEVAGWAAGMPYLLRKGWRQQVRESSPAPTPAPEVRHA
ncbi:MAG TPA: glycosyltransferase [Caulobacteraceae bacterium]|nr:glycosyltransferase [Caulobacteraceae bacterium]